MPFFTEYENIMPDLMTWLQNYWKVHGVIGLMAGWLVFSSVLNVLLSLKPAEFWIAFAEANPKLAAIVRMVRAAGIDPMAALKALQVYFDEKSKDNKKDEKKDL